MAKKTIYKLKEVFVAGGLPNITYVYRDSLKLEQKLERALSKPHYFTSITGTSKSGKTVLLHNVLEKKNFVGVDGGQVKDINTLWFTVSDRLSQPSSVTTVAEVTKDLSRGTKFGASAQIPQIFSIQLGADRGESEGEKSSISSQRLVDLQNKCIDYLLINDVILVIDDFHYIDRENQTQIIRNLKNAVFNGLKVVLLSVPYRAYEAIQAEVEITGRFVHVNVPDWNETDLAEIAHKGFKALSIGFPKERTKLFANEANGSPQLMQAFCWEACAELGVFETRKRTMQVNKLWDPSNVFENIAADSGQPIYDKLASGPQSRSDRIDRPLKNGQKVDIYKALLFAIAQTGPKKSLSYDEIRTSLSNCLLDKIPQKIEVSNALNHLAKISVSISEDSRPIDWVEDDLRLELPDPMFRFFLKWKLIKAKSPG